MMSPEQFFMEWGRKEGLENYDINRIYNNPHVWTFVRAWTEYLRQNTNSDAK